MFIFDLFTDIHRTVLPFQVKRVRVDMSRTFQAREKGVVPHPAYLRPLPWPALFTDIHHTVFPIQVKGVRVDMSRTFQAREKGVVTHPAYPLFPVPWPAGLSEYIIFTFVRDIRDKGT
jgi:hypothetical protein